MNILSAWYNNFVEGRPALGLLLFRTVTGLALMIHGWPKIQNPTGWMPGGIPEGLQAIAAVSEFFGGLFLLLGLFTPVAAIFVAGLMVGALTIAHAGQPWIAPGGRSAELPVSYLVAAITLLLTGPGKYSLDYRLFGRKAPGYADVESKQTAGIR